MPAFLHLLSRFRKDERGVFGVIFGLIAVVLVALAGCVVDFSYMQTIRSRAQTALDASALALQAKMSTLTNDQIKTKAQALLIERLSDSTVTAEIIGVTKDINAGTLNLRAHISVPTIFVQMVGVRKLDAVLLSEVTQSSANLEVSLALDTTGSMAGSKINALIQATKNLIPMVVKDQQPPDAPSYSKLAMVPYSYGVNVNNPDITTYLGANLIDKVRGTEIGGTPITNIAWASGAAQPIASITKANPAKVTLKTTATMNFADGAFVYITGVTGMTAINGSSTNIYVARNPNTSNRTFELYASDGVTKIDTSGNGYGAANNNTGTARQCLLSTCEIIVYSTAHGLASGDPVYITGTSGATGTPAIKTANIDNPQDVDQVLSADSFTLAPLHFGPNYTTYSSGGTAYCMLYGCHYYNFMNISNPSVGQTFTASANCVTERTGTNKYNDNGPALAIGSALTSPATFMYPSSAGNCEAVPLIPLTTDKTKLIAAADDLVAAGSTAGHIGLAWAWYMLAPKWGYLWPAASQPHAYKEDNLVKAIILMTDGQFNTQYYNGVIAQDSDNIDGAGNMIDHDSNNGESSAQALALCTAIKSTALNTGIIIYTVGFQIGSNSATDVAARSLLSSCASSGSDFYLATSASDLDDAFQEIARNLSALRVSK